MTNELGEYGPGSYISHFVSAGPKFYTYIVKSPNGQTHEICKVKGLTLNASIDGKVNYDSIKSLVLDKDKILTHTCKTIRRIAQHSVVTREETKSYKATSMKRKFTSENTSCPYGFKRPRIE